MVRRKLFNAIDPSWNPPFGKLFFLPFQMGVIQFKYKLTFCSSQLWWILQPQMTVSKIWHFYKYFPQMCNLIRSCFCTFCILCNCNFLLLIPTKMYNKCNNKCILLHCIELLSLIGCVKKQPISFFNWNILQSHLVTPVSELVLYVYLWPPGCWGTGEQ